MKKSSIGKDEVNVDDHKYENEAETLLKSKMSGQRRTNPQEGAETVSKQKEVFACDQCGYALESQGLLEAH